MPSLYLQAVMIWLEINSPFIWTTRGSGLNNTARFQGVLELCSSILHGFICVPRHIRQGCTNHRALLYDYAIPNNVHPICTPSALALAFNQFCGIRLQ